VELPEEKILEFLATGEFAALIRPNATAIGMSVLVKEF
jgi:hypothetical protein